MILSSARGQLLAKTCSDEIGNGTHAVGAILAISAIAENHQSRGTDRNDEVELTQINEEQAKDRYQHHIYRSSLTTIVQGENHISGERELVSP